MSINYRIKYLIESFGMNVILKIQCEISFVILAIIDTESKERDTCTINAKGNKSLSNRRNVLLGESLIYFRNW